MIVVYLVTYDLNEPVKNYNTVIAAIKRFGAWAHVLKSAWLVETTLSAYQVQEELFKVIDKSDRIFITRVPGWGGWIDTEFAAWLRQRGL